MTTLENPNQVSETDSLLIKAAKLGIKLTIEPENDKRTMYARQLITKVRVAAHSETYGQGHLELYRLDEYAANPEGCMAFVLGIAVRATETIRRHRP